MAADWFVDEHPAGTAFACGLASAIWTPYVFATSGQTPGPTGWEPSGGFWEWVEFLVPFVPLLLGPLALLLGANALAGTGSGSDYIRRTAGERAYAVSGVLLGVVVTLALMLLAIVVAAEYGQGPYLHHHGE